VFKEKEYRMEKPVLLEEILVSSDDANTILFKETDRFLYKGSPYSEPVDDIEYHRLSSVAREYKETLDYYHTYYQPHNVVVSIVTNDSFGKVKKIMSNTFFSKETQWNNRIPRMIQTLPTLPTDNHITYKVLEKKGMESQHLCITFRTCLHENVDRYPLNLLSQIVGGSMSSRISLILREQNGLNYESECFTDYVKIGGEFNIYAVLNPAKLIYNNNKHKKGVLPLLIDLVKELILHGITKEELDIAKGNYKGKLVLQQKHIKNVSEYNGIQHAVYENEPFILYDDIYERCYEKLTVNNLREVIAKYFTASNMCVTILGEKGEKGEKGSHHYHSLEQIQQICDKLFL